MNDRGAAIRYVALAVALSSSPALAETTFGGVAALNGGYGSNPRLLTQASGGSTATVIASISPVVTIAAPRTTVVAGGDVRYTHYSTLYKDQTDYSSRLSLTHLLSPSSSFLLGGRYARRTLTAIDALAVPDGELPPDPSLFINGGRKVEEMGANTSVSARLDANLSLEAHADASQTRYLNSTPDLLSTNLASYGAGFSVTRQVNGRLGLGGGLDVRKTHYLQSLYGDGRQVTPSVIANYVFSSGLKLSANAGVTFIKIDGVGPIPGRNSTTLSGRISFCRTRPRSTLCASANRTVSPTTFSGASTITAVNANYNYQTSPHGSVTLTVNYSQSKALTSVASKDYSYIGGDVSYQHQLMRRLSAVAKAQYVDPINSNVARKASFYGSIGISYRLGRAQ